jgi:hypothetical protein
MSQTCLNFVNTLSYVKKTHILQLCSFFSLLLSLFIFLCTYTPINNKVEVCCSNLAITDVSMLTVSYYVSEFLLVWVVFALLFFFFFCSIGVWTQDLHLEPLYQSFFVMGFSRDRVSKTSCLGWLWAASLLISVSWVAWNIGVSPQCPDKNWIWMKVSWISVNNNEFICLLVYMFITNILYECKMSITGETGWG